ncbi:hypothetical protein HWV23_16320 [Natronomonas halophila]|uniref:hypothetical protein n=1 Tax=Natronomonas halophila TaxID=2747817 RepID=UPI0015B53DC3|nr:hypothetical protein [Natronomonas halophila]QLD87221.1 hypothetical protein HWV23_16320 [Natronomonas halophila]
MFRTADRPMTVYVTAQVLAVALAGGIAWALAAAGAPVWGAVVGWVGFAAYLSRKRLPSEAMGAALQFGAALVVLAPAAPYLPALVDGADLSPVGFATKAFGPALVFVLFSGIAYGCGVLLKRRARRKLAKRARRGGRKDAVSGDA